MGLEKESIDTLRKKHEIWKRRKILFRDLKDTKLLKVAKKATKAIEQARKHMAYTAKDSNTKGEEKSDIRKP